LLTPKQDVLETWHANAASYIISVENNYTPYRPPVLTVGGTSAGMAILGNYVFTAEYIREGSLTSADILGNYYTTKFYRASGSSLDNTVGISIADDVLSLEWMGGVLTEPHFTDWGSDRTKQGDVAIYRLGRFISFLGSVVLEPTRTPLDGLEQLGVAGIAVDRSTALTITYDGDANVWGGGYVYFASADNAAIQNNNKLFMTGVQMCWYNNDDGTFDYTTAWERSGDYYSIFNLENGLVTLTDGTWPPFPLAPE
jgi:cyanophycinase-like exopeptidase